MRRMGFARRELVAVAACVGVLTLCVVLPALNRIRNDAPFAPMMRRGKDIWVAVTQAEVERRALWPSEGMGFADSTAYFRWLVEEERVAGMDCALLAGAGVPVCPDGALTAEHNAWTVAQDCGDGAGEMFPVLVTRNVDASSLASPETVTNRAWQVRFDAAGRLPYSWKGFVLVRKNGAAVAVQGGRMGYGDVYGWAARRRGKAGGEAVSRAPLRYLTPWGVAEPGGGAEMKNEE